MRSDMPMQCRNCMRTRAGRTCRRNMCKFIPRPRAYSNNISVSTEYVWVKNGDAYVFVKKDSIKSDKE